MTFVGVSEVIQEKIQAKLVLLVPLMLNVPLLKNVLTEFVSVNAEMEN